MMLNSRSISGCRFIQVLKSTKTAIMESKKMMHKLYRRNLGKIVKMVDAMMYR